MPVNKNTIKEGGHYAAGTQVRRVAEIATKTVERTPRPSATNPSRKPVKKRLKRVRYQSRGHNAAMKYGPPIWVDLDKFANDVDKPVVGHCDPDYDDR